MYLILLQDSIYQSGTLCSSIIFSYSSDTPFPLRTFSIMEKAVLGGSPLYMRYTIMSSRVDMHSLRVVKPSFMKYCALLIQTSVPWESPEILTRSEKVLG